MNCREFREIADTYLSNELLVETNHSVLRHLEACNDCRELLRIRRHLRERLRNSVRNFPVSAIDPAFAARVSDELRRRVRRGTRPFPNFRLTFASVVAFLLIGILGIAIFRSSHSNPELSENRPLPAVRNTELNEIKPVPAALFETSAEAIDDHKNCALAHNLGKKPISLDEAARDVDGVNKDFDLAVIGSLQEAFGPEAKLIKAHFCVIHGRYFSHVIVGYRDRVISVLLTNLNDFDVDTEPVDCEAIEGLRSACFSSSGYGVFIVSDMPESDNLLFANTIKGAVRRQTAKGRFSV